MLGVDPMIFVLNCIVIFMLDFFELSKCCSKCHKFGEVFMFQFPNHATLKLSNCENDHTPPYVFNDKTNMLPHVLAPQIDMEALCLS